MNMFRFQKGHPREGQLDKEYLRICSTYKLLSTVRIDVERARHLLKERQVTKADQLVSIWRRDLKIDINEPEIQVVTRDEDCSPVGLSSR